MIFGYLFNPTEQNRTNPVTSSDGNGGDPRIQRNPMTTISVFYRRIHFVGRQIASVDGRIQFVAGDGRGGGPTDDVSGNGRAV